jgi:hypothetical protein
MQTGYLWQRLAGTAGTAGTAEDAFYLRTTESQKKVFIFLFFQSVSQANTAPAYISCRGESFVKDVQKLSCMAQETVKWARLNGEKGHMYHVHNHRRHGSNYWLVPFYKDKKFLLPLFCPTSLAPSTLCFIAAPELHVYALHFHMRDHVFLC